MEDELSPPINNDLLRQRSSLKEVSIPQRLVYKKRTGLGSTTTNGIRTTFRETDRSGITEQISEIM